MDEKTLILSLIQDDLINQKLLNIFRDMGIDAEAYQLNLGEIIFNRMGIKRGVDDTTFDNYMRFAEMAKYLPITEPSEFQFLALEIYSYLDKLPRKKTTKK